MDIRNCALLLIPLQIASFFSTSSHRFERVDVASDPMKDSNIYTRALPQTPGEQPTTAEKTSFFADAFRAEAKNTYTAFANTRETLNSNFATRPFANLFQIGAALTAAFIGYKVITGIVFPTLKGLGSVLSAVLPVRSTSKPVESEKPVAAVPSTKEEDGKKPLPLTLDPSFFHITAGDQKFRLIENGKGNFVMQLVDQNDLQKKSPVEPLMIEEIPST